MAAILKEKVEVEVAVNPKMGKSLPMKILRWAWIVLTICLFGMAFISVYILPDSMARLMQITPFLTGLTIIMSGIAFGGSAIKRHDLLKNGNK